MFTKITLENFRSFDHIVFDLTEKGNVPKHLLRKDKVDGNKTKTYKRKASNSRCYLSR